MAEFKIKMNVTIDAENIDDALLQLSDHFTLIRRNAEAESPVVAGEINISPVLVEGVRD